MKCRSNEDHQQVLRVSRKSLAVLQRRVHEERWSTGAQNEHSGSGKRATYMSLLNELAKGATNKRSLRHSYIRSSCVHLEDLSSYHLKKSPFPLAFLSTSTYIFRIFRQEINLRDTAKRAISFQGDCFVSKVEGNFVSRVTQKTRTMSVDGQGHIYI